MLRYQERRLFGLSEREKAPLQYYYWSSIIVGSSLRLKSVEITTSWSVNALARNTTVTVDCGKNTTNSPNSNRFKHKLRRAQWRAVGFWFRFLCPPQSGDEASRWPGRTRISTTTVRCYSCWIVPRPTAMRPTNGAGFPLWNRSCGKFFAWVQRPLQHKISLLLI